ncbi:hypothetical protein BOTBODRAFT_365903 [Botryobasidium botryosum FD-172 SS1]|uniref:Uncharacterized protein n=1 Tax=Botryobasidium botryosum (strain FD-172 SS1) TaxID=930990 RepID=A0A067MDQ9_BOTB1|nr:hypothetical protein BOTBODRAFT_365903 [Botryobasidium botryosum FD-172 SS1]
MVPFTIATLLLAFVPLVFCAPALAPILPTVGAVKPSSYIVKLKDGVDKTVHMAALASVLISSDSHVTDDYSGTFNGYAAILGDAALQFVRSSNDVDYLDPDHLIAVNVDKAVSGDVAWKNLIAQPPASSGTGVDIYAVGTGIYTAHSSFGSRASWGVTFGGYSNIDGNGHGTHTAATAVGATYGVAPSANIIAVKVLSDAGSGPVSDIVAGINWAVAAGVSSGRPSIVMLCLSGNHSTSLEDAVSAGVSRGIHFVVEAGGSNVDATNTSPANVATAVTVGAVDSSNAKAPFSNYGTAIDVFAPGVNVKSAWIGANMATNILSGTSSATAYVASVLASALSGSGNSTTPAALTSSLKSHAKTVVTGVKSDTAYVPSNLILAALSVLFNPRSRNLLATVW